MIVQHLHPQPLEELGVCKSGLYAMRQLKNAGLSADRPFQFTRLCEILHEPFHPWPVCIGNLDNVAVAKALEVINKLCILLADAVQFRKANLGPPDKEGW